VVSGLLRGWTLIFLNRRPPITAALDIAARKI